ncbi:MAG: rhamnulokinase [Clostridia bacterium]|nr:rhamnulokinase [Clostridia bacterium]
MTYCLAIDIGASSGRHILSHIQDGKIVSEEIYRFENGFKESKQELYWDVEALFQSVLEGICKCKELGKIPATVAIDTWGVDYVLLDGQKKEILPAMSYRDSRTEAVIAEVESLVSAKELYSACGIQKISFNTVYQLYCDKKSGKLENAEHFLMIPEYLNFRLTGEIRKEYTNASTTSLVNAKDKDWDMGIIEKLGLPAKIFEKIYLPGTRVGGFTDEVKEKAGFDSTVILCTSHDTASAVAGSPSDVDCMFISSGTWSLVGTENLEPCTNDAAREANFANEGGIDYRFRFLKNIMGMWLFQSIRRETNKQYTYDEMMYMAMESKYTRRIDPTDEAFLAPKSMIGAIREYLGEPELPLSDVLASVYHSLAYSYDLVVKEVERICDKKIDKICIVGGGCQDRYLNALTKQYTGKKVTAGPVEATAMGNLIVQLIYNGLAKDLADARNITVNSFNIKEVE